LDFSDFSEKKRGVVPICVFFLPISPQDLKKQGRKYHENTVKHRYHKMVVSTKRKCRKCQNVRRYFHTTKQIEKTKRF
ncbi:MAG: hypothetical protein J6Q22_06270, partial [Prevotella sp.]|nr:hypothetical protein [Prevotella sp.]